MLPIQLHRVIRIREVHQIKAPPKIQVRAPQVPRDPQVPNQVHRTRVKALVIPRALQVLIVEEIINFISIF